MNNQKIGSWYENPREYTTEYWIYLEPDKNSVKNYRVKGTIDKINIYEEGSSYLLRSVQWNNGNETYFHECFLTNPTGDYCYDIDDKGYTVRLGNKVTK